MMNKLKKASVLFVLLLAFVLYSSVGAKAIEWGEIQIDDAVGGVGGELYVNITMTTGGSPIGSTELAMSFDPYVLEFVRGTNATAGYGTVTVMAAGDGEETSLDYYIVFRGLVEGSSYISMVSFMTWTYAGDALYANWNQGTVTIGPEGAEATGPRGPGAGEGEVFEGAPTGDSAIFQIQGSDFTIFDHFSDAMVPAGFTRDQFNVRGNLHNGMRHNASGRVFMYAVTGTNDPILALLDEAADTLWAAEIRNQGGDRFVIVVDQPNVVVPPEFRFNNNFVFGGTQFSAWQSEENPDFNLVYGISNAGWEGLYIFDSMDETFQRFLGPIVEPEEVEDEADEPTDLLGRVVSIIRDNIVIVLAAILIVIFLLLIIIIVLSVKVQRRNNELDELYAEGHGTFDDSDDDYDDYEDDEFEEDEDDYDDDYEVEGDRYHDDGYEDDGYDEVGYDETDYETGVSYDDDDYDDDDYEDDDYDDDDYDDADEEDDERKDDFNIDFVDL